MKRNYTSVVVQPLPRGTARPLDGFAHGEFTVIKPQPVVPPQRVASKLVNHLPVRCAVCDRYIGFLAGLPVILSAKEQIIEFAHPGCCA